MVLNSFTKRKWFAKSRGGQVIPCLTLPKYQIYRTFPKKTG